MNCFWIHFLIRCVVVINAATSTTTSTTTITTTTTTTTVFGKSSSSRSGYYLEENFTRYQLVTLNQSVNAFHSLRARGSLDCAAECVNSFPQSCMAYYFHNASFLCTMIIKTDPYNDKVSASSSSPEQKFIITTLKEITIRDGFENRLFPHLNLTYASCVHDKKKLGIIAGKHDFHTSARLCRIAGGQLVDVYTQDDLNRLQRCVFTKGQNEHEKYWVGIYKDSGTPSQWRHMGDNSTFPEDSPLWGRNAWALKTVALCAYVKPSGNMYRVDCDYRRVEAVCQHPYP